MFTPDQFKGRYGVSLSASAGEIVDFSYLDPKTPVPSTILTAKVMSYRAIRSIVEEFGYSSSAIMKGLCGNCIYKGDSRETTRVVGTPVSMRVDAILRVAAKIAMRRPEEPRVSPRDIFIAAISSEGIVSTLFESYGTANRINLINAYTAPPEET